MPIQTPICDFGQKAHDFKLKSTDNKIISLNDVKGKNGTLIMFICNHCPYVKAVIEEVVQDCKKLESNGIKAVAVCSNDVKNYPEDSFDNMIKFSQNHNFNFPYLFDETQEIAKKYGAVCTPDPFLFDSEKKLIFHGRIDDAMNPEAEVSEKVMINNIQKFLEGQKIEKDFDPSIGCSIKWKEQQT